MATVTITINTDGEAFQDDEYQPLTEIEEIMRMLRCVDWSEMFYGTTFLVDTNGNVCGTIERSEDK